MLKVVPNNRDRDTRDLMSQTKFYEGLASSFELYQAQNQLYTSQNQLLLAMIDLINENTNLETLLHQTPAE